MGASCSNPPKVKDEPKEAIKDMKRQLKAKKEEIELIIKKKDKEIEKLKELALFYLKNGNEHDAKNQIKVKQYKQEEIKILHSQIDILNDELNKLENCDVNEDIEFLSKSIKKTIYQVNIQIGVRDMETEIKKMVENKKGENGENPDVLEELKQLQEEIKNNHNPK